LKTAKVIAGEGYRLGGPAPYGLVRVLVDASGKEVEELPPGKKVDQLGCRVRIKPKDWEKIRVWVWIIEQFERGLGTRAIANRLTEQGIPTPAAGSKRKRNGIDVPVSTAWHSETVMQLLRNPVIIGLQAYGRQSAGTHKRWSPDGPRDMSRSSSRSGGIGYRRCWPTARTRRFASRSRGRSISTHWPLACTASARGAVP